MGNTYTQLYIHIVFAVKNRVPLLTNIIKNDLCKYITGIIQNNNHKVLAVNGYLDHIHIFLGYNPDSNLSYLVRDIKSNSTRFIKHKHNIIFNWQAGYGAFSYSSSQKDAVIKYILNQEQHHKGKTFKKEYLKLLDDFEIKYQEKYIID